MMHPIVRLIWHFGGLAMFVAGSAMLAGWAGALMALGCWAMAGTLYDRAMGR